MKFRVYDSRNNETLFESDVKQLCINFMNEIWEEDSTDYIYSWLEEVDV
ncbi:hypothetical protein [Lederbergia lenta]|nr:hypothetical protein [Lederbergia lenta]MCM3109925.1 hypothetical protein [Lederbergia lenta]